MSDTFSADVVTMVAAAEAWPAVRQAIGMRRNCCVQASLALAEVLRAFEIDAEAVPVRTHLVVPSVGRLVEYGVTPGVEYRGRGPQPDGYDFHAIVVAPAGFVDLTLDAHELAPGPVGLPWQAVTFDHALVAEVAPDALRGDAWAAFGTATVGPWAGAGEPMAATWEMLDRQLGVRDDQRAHIETIKHGLYRRVLDVIG